MNEDQTTATAAWLYLHTKPHSDRTPRRSLFGLLVHCLRELLDPRREWFEQTVEVPTLKPLNQLRKEEQQP